MTLFGHCDHRLLIHRICVDVGKNDRAVGRQGVLIPLGTGGVVVLYPRPRIDGQDLAVQDGIGIHCLLAQHVLQALEIHGNPVLELLPALSLLDPPVDGLGAEGDEGLIDREVVALLGGVALGQGRTRLLRILQQLGPQHPAAGSTDDQEGQQHQEVGPHLSEDPLPAARPRLHPKVSRMARQVSS